MEKIDVVEEGDPTPIMKRLKMIEDQFMQNPNLYDPGSIRKNKDSKTEVQEEANPD